MIGHNTSAALVSAASEINQEHKGMLAAIEDSETRARRIGRILIDLKPALKAASVNLTDFCKDHLPFGKSAAYEFISIANDLPPASARNPSISGRYFILVSPTWTAPRLNDGM